MSTPVHQRPRVKVFCTITRASLEADCRRIASVIRETNRARGVGTLLFIDPSGAATLVPDDHAAADWLFRRQFDQFVCLYQLGVENAMDPNLQGLIEDITDHMGF